MTAKAINPSWDQFRLEGKSIRLQEPLDRDESDLSSIVFQVMMMMTTMIVMMLMVPLLLLLVFQVLFCDQKL